MAADLRRPAGPSVVTPGREDPLTSNDFTPIDALCALDVGKSAHQTFLQAHLLEGFWAVRWQSSGAPPILVHQQVEGVTWPRSLRQSI